MKKLGIILCFTPRELVPYEGIARLIGFIVNGAVKTKKISIAIAGPAWLKKDIQLLLEDAGVDYKKVEIVTTHGEPFLIRFWRLSQKFKRKARIVQRRNRILNTITEIVGYIVEWLSSASIFVFLSGALVFTLLSAILAIPMLMLGTLAAFLFIFRRFLLRIRNTYLYKFKQPILMKLRYILETIRPLDTIRSKETDRLVKKLNKRRDIDIWYVPSMFWPEVAKLNSKILMAAPDIVFYEHPAQFLSPDSERMLDRITGSIKAADNLICYSDYVKEKHLVQRQGVPAEKIHVLRHGFVDMASIENGKNSQQEALDTLHTYIKKNKNTLPEYLNGFRFDDVDFLFYSSQVRPHKNIESLIVVFERLLREHYRSVKLVLTGNIMGNQRLRDLVDEHNLGRDVISLPSVPNTVLAALYRLATCSVTPTQFEGGFPFTFTEAYSVGTPSIMSRIAVVDEIIKDETLLKTMTFDPHNQREMLERILWALDNRDELISLQKPLFDQLQKRSWSLVADEYIDLAMSLASETNPITHSVLKH